MAFDENRVPEDERREFFFDAKTGAPLTDEQWDHQRAIMKQFGNDPFDSKEQS